MVSESHIYLARCRSCCRRSSLCCAERASRLWVPASQNEGGKQEMLRRRRERNRKRTAVTCGWTVVTPLTFRRESMERILVVTGLCTHVQAGQRMRFCTQAQRAPRRMVRKHLASSPGQFFANITAWREKNTYFSPAVIILLAKNRPGDEARKHCVY